MEDVSRGRIGILSGHLQAALEINNVGTASLANPEYTNTTPTLNATRASNGVVAELQKLLEHDNYEDRAKLKELMRDPLFIPRWNISIEEERELALERLRVLCHSGNFSITDFRTNPLRIFAAHECATLTDVSMATKMTVQFNLFGGTILKLGTKKHHDLLLKGIDDVTDVGCFALTEVGYGNNAVCMPTTATFHEDSQGGHFIIRTMNPLSAKTWATNGANHAHWAVVFAQLMIKKTNHGIHGFLVQIRDHRTMLPCPGVTINDLGHKIGCNGVDNAKFIFHGKKKRLIFSSLKYCRCRLFFLFCFLDLNINKYSLLSSSSLFTVKMSEYLVMLYWTHRAKSPPTVPSPQKFKNHATDFWRWLTNS